MQTLLQLSHVPYAGAQEVDKCSVLYIASLAYLQAYKKHQPCMWLHTFTMPSASKNK